MKKIGVLAAVLILAASLLTAQESGGSSYSKNHLTFEVSASVLAFAFNQTAIYDRMLTQNVGLGVGIMASESSWTDFALFADVKAWKWSFGMGPTFNANSDADPVGFLWRAVYHGNSWQWGPGKAGMVLGVEEHIFGFESSDGGNGIMGLICELPRFVCGINWQLDL